jgi:hypothetical protein
MLPDTCATSWRDRRLGLRCTDRRIACMRVIGAVPSDLRDVCVDWVKQLRQKLPIAASVGGDSRC